MRSDRLVLVFIDRKRGGTQSDTRSKFRSHRRRSRSIPQRVLARLDGTTLLVGHSFSAMIVQ